MRQEIRIVTSKRGMVSGFKYPSCVICVAMLLFLLAGSMTFAQPAAGLYKTANQLYKANQFDSAVVSYEKIISQGYKTPEVYYNLGNSYFKLNNVSKSILNYERALKLAPQDEDVIHNLKLANTKVIDKLVPVPQLGVITGWNNMVSSRSAKAWGTMAMVFMWLALVAFVVYLFIGIRRLSFFLGFVLVVCSMACMSLGFKQADKEQNADAAVLTVANSFIKSAPDANGNDLFMLHEGVKFQILDKVGDWTKIRLIDGKVGWIERGSFEKI